MPVATGRTAAWAKINEISLYMSAKMAPREDDWAEYIEWYQRTIAKPGTTVRTLVYDRSTGPNAAQRSLLTKVTSKCTMHVSVLTPSALVRGIVTAMNWFNDGYKAFAPEDIDRALDFIGSSRLTAEEAKKIVRGLIVELDQ